VTVTVDPVVSVDEEHVDEEVLELLVDKEQVLGIGGAAPQTANPDKIDRQEDPGAH